MIDTISFRGIGISLSLLLWAASGAVRAQEPSFPFGRPVEGMDLTAVELIALPLDAEVYAATRDDLADVRLLDRNGEAVPYILRPATVTETRSSRRTWTGRNPAVRPLADDGLEVILQLADDDPRPQGLRLVSPLQNFENRVRVYAATSAPISGQNWGEPLADTVLFDYTRFMDVRNDSIAFPESAARWFRIVIDDVTSEQESELLALTRRLQGDEEQGRSERITIERRPFRIDRVEFWRVNERARVTGQQTIEYPAGELTVEQDPDSSDTWITVPAGNAPINELRLVTEASNFSRPVQVQREETRGTAVSWQTLGSATLSRIAFRDVRNEQLAISIPESREDRYRVVISNGDSQPLDVSGVVLTGPVYEVVFLAAPNVSYELVYGAEDARAPNYDTAAMRMLLQRFTPTVATLGAVTERAVVVPEATLTEWFVDPRVLVAVIALLVLVLGWALYHAARSVDATTEGDQSS